MIIFKEKHCVSGLENRLWWKARVVAASPGRMLLSSRPGVVVTPKESGGSGDGKM